MRILCATPFVPYPPTYGGTIISYHHLKGLAERGHRLVMVLPLRRPGDREGVESMRLLGGVRAVSTLPRSPLRIAASALARGESMRIARHRFRAVEDAFTRAIRDDGPFDVVYLDSVFTSYLSPIARRDAPSTPVVLLELNVESQVFHRWIERKGSAALQAFSLWEMPRILRAERSAHASVDGVLTLSEEDARSIRAGVPAAKTFVLGPGIATYAGEEIPGPPSRRTVLFLGSYQWPPNVDGAEWIARSIWPRVRERVPDARLVLAGLDPARRVAPLADPACGIEAAGFVESAVRTTREAAVCIVPLRVGGGIRLKILEALANERPVVTTTLGAEGLGLMPGTHALFADDEETFANAVAGLLEHEDEARRIAREGRRFVEERYAWPRVLDRLESFLASVSAQGRSTR